LYILIFTFLTEDTSEGSELNGIKHYTEYNVNIVKYA
jgi:hypothetical protein